MTFDPDYKEKEELVSETCVVNLRLEKYDVYIGRAGKGQDGYFGNPHTMGGIYCKHCKGYHDRAGSIAAFKQDFLKRIEEDKEFRVKVIALRGKTLGCFCKQKDYEVPCHGDIYKEWLDKHPNA